MKVIEIEPGYEVVEKDCYQNFNVATNPLFIRKRGDESAIRKGIGYYTEEGTAKLNYTNDLKHNSLLIGINAGADLTDGQGVIIIGDNIRNLDKNQKGVLFLSDNIAIGKTIRGKKFNLRKVLKQLKNKVQ